MEGMTLFISIIFIVFGILQIMLFFKMWGMTNEVTRLQFKLAPTPHQMLMNAEVEYKIGNIAQGDEMTKRVIVITGEKSHLGIWAKNLQDKYKA